MSILYLGLAIVSICIAHLIRVARWQLFIEIYEKPNKRNLTQALSVGYLLNYVLPYKLGDLFRAWFAGRNMKNGKALGFSTVIVDRYLDVVAVGIIFIFLGLGGHNNEVVRRSTLFYVLMAASFLGIAVLIYAFRRILKKVIRKLASIFNPQIEFSILKFAWALIWNFKDMFSKINKWRLALSTVGMWCFYLLSYYLYGAFMNTLGDQTSWVDVFTILFTQNGIKASTFDLPLLYGGNISNNPFYMMTYMVIPLIIMLLVALFFKESQLHQYTEECLNLLPHLDPRERLEFLENYFSDKNKDYVMTYLKINQGISIIRDYSAGSNATTMLCMDGERTFFRKYAFGQDGEKLYEQIQWIENYKNYLPLPEIIRREKDDIYCFYDMPYSSSAVGLFEYVHSMPVEQGWKMIKCALESLENSIYRMNVSSSDSDTIHRYIESKVNRNLEKIKSAKKIKSLLAYDTIYVNGVAYNNLPYYEKYLSEDYLQKIFKGDFYAVIHGDLTIENIICERNEEGKDDFYIIDPNTGNVHDSPNLDYAKLLQSIHGGYEFLMSTHHVNVSGDRIDFLFTKSSAYAQLHERLKQYMQERFGMDRTRSIYYHEIIHWLRLMPYKIEKDEKRALLFYAGMLMVMSDVIAMYGDLEVK